MFNRWFWLALGALFYLNAAAALACNTEICPNDPSAVHFDGSNFVNELTSSGGIYNLPTYTNSIFLSFWVRFTDPSDNFGLMNANYSNHTGGGDDPAVAVVAGTSYIELEYFPQYTIPGSSGSDGLAILRGPGVSADGNWHHVVIYVSDAASNAHQDAMGNWIFDIIAQYAIDGSIGDMTTVSANATFWVSGSTFLGLNTGIMNTWILGSSLGTGQFGIQTADYTGDLAEWYVNFNSMGSGTLTSGLVSKFYVSGSALGLGPNCTGPTGSVPNMCNRGDPCDFIFGPKPNMAPSYLLRKPQGSSPPLLNGADTDPCLTPGNGQGCAPNH